MTGCHRAARISDVAPGATLEPHPFRLLVRGLGVHPLVQIAGEIVHAEAAGAARSGPARHALIEPGELLPSDSRALRVDLVEVGINPRVIDIALLWIAREAIR